VDLCVFYEREIPSGMLYKAAANIGSSFLDLRRSAGKRAAPAGGQMMLFSLTGGTDCDLRVVAPGRALPLLGRGSCFIVFPSAPAVDKALISPTFFSGNAALIRPDGLT